MNTTTPKKVILHGRLATLKSIKMIDGEKRGEVWQGSSRYFIPVNELVWAE